MHKKVINYNFSTALTKNEQNPSDQEFVSELQTGLAVHFFFLFNHGRHRCVVFSILHAQLSFFDLQYDVPVNIHSPPHIHTHPSPLALKLPPPLWNFL